MTGSRLFIQKPRKKNSSAKNCAAYISSHWIKCRQLRPACSYIGYLFWNVSSKLTTNTSTATTRNATP